MSFLAAASFAAFPGLLYAACGDGKPAKHRLALSWNGHADSARYSAGVREFHRRLASNMDRHYVGRGHGRQPEDASWAPPPDEKTSVLPATKRGLADIARGISEDVAKLTRSGEAADDIELVIYVTNHGEKAAGGNDFGIRTRGTDDDGKALARGDAVLWSSDLRRFARSLPKGIRVKTVFAQCYGSDTQSAFLAAVDTDDKCKCGLARANPGLPSWGKEKSGGAIDQDWSRNWDHQVFASLASGRGLAQARMVSLTHASYGLSPVASFRDGRFVTAMNGNMTSSQTILHEALGRAFRDQIGLLNALSTLSNKRWRVAEWTSTSFLSRANLLWRAAENMPLSPEDKKRVAERTARDVTLARGAGIDTSGIPAARRQLRDASSRKPFLTEWELLGERPDRDPQLSAKIVAAQEALEEVFFKVATQEEKDRFLARALCEGDPLVDSAEGTTHPPSRTGAGH